MNTRLRVTCTLASLVLIPLALGGCGNKGPLFLPAPAPEPVDVPPEPEPSPQAAANRMDR